jgi:hypothetical protein
LQIVQACIVVPTACNVVPTTCTGMPTACINVEEIEGAWSLSVIWLRILGYEPRLRSTIPSGPQIHQPGRRILNSPVNLNVGTLPLSGVPLGS